MTKQKLYYPKHVIIPGVVAQNNNIPDGAQKFYGIINGLAHASGYAYGEDEDFAELMGKDVRTVQRWFEILEKETDLCRCTKMHRNSDDRMKKEGLQRWRKSRKIYIGNGISNNSCERDKNVGFYGRDKNVGYKDKALKEEKTNTSPPKDVEKKEREGSKVNGEVANV